MTIEELFEELLEDYISSEESLICDYGMREEDYRELNRKIEYYRTYFNTLRRVEKL